MRVFLTKAADHEVFDRDDLSFVHAVQVVHRRPRGVKRKMVNYPICRAGPLPSAIHST